MSNQNKLERLLRENTFDQLILLQNQAIWEDLSDGERELLGLFLVKQAERNLVLDQKKAMQSLAAAIVVSPESSKILFHQAEVYLNEVFHDSCLHVAKNLLEKAVTLEPKFFDAKYALAQVLAKMGICYEESELLSRAEVIFSELQNEQADHALLYWEWGLCFYHMGLLSGEISDFYYGLDKLKKAQEYRVQEPKFTFDLANIIFEISKLTYRPELFQQAASLYKIVVDQEQSNLEALIRMATCYFQLHTLDNSESNFNIANDIFEKIAILDPSNPMLWLRWGDLFLCKGKFLNDVNYLQSSLGKFEKAIEMDEEDPQAYILAAEAQMLLGASLEDLDQLKKAEFKVVKALQKFPENSEGWYILGICYSEYGRYFSDTSFYFQALQKFAYGLQYDKDNFFLLYGMALAHFAIGELEDDSFHIEKSLTFCRDALERGGKKIPQFWNDWGVALLKLAELTGEQKHIHEAVEKFELAIQLFRNDSPSGQQDAELEWLYNYGCALDYLGELNEDYTYYEKSAQILSFVIEQDPGFSNARYNLALVLSHLAESTDDVECFFRADDHFKEYLRENSEDEIAWNDWGVALLNLALLLNDPFHPELSQKCFIQAENKLFYSASLGCNESFYNIACLFSLVGNTSMSIHYLEKAQACEALPSLEEVMNDEWLEGIKNTPTFQTFINYLISKQQNE